MEQVVQPMDPRLVAVQLAHFQVKQLQEQKEQQELVPEEVEVTMEVLAA